MNEEKRIYKFEAPPIDYWDGWHDLLDFSEVISSLIMKNPKSSLSYKECKDEIDELYTRVLCDNFTCKTKDMRGYGFKLWFNENCLDFNSHLYIWAKKPNFVIAYKKDNNGTVEAFSFHHFLETKDNDFHFEKDVEEFFKENIHLETIEIPENAIPHDNENRWEIYNPY